MVVEKTTKRFLHTLAYRRSRSRERVLVCPSYCRTPDSHFVMNRSGELAQIAAPGKTFGYDVEIYVGLARFMEFRQREEIQNELQSKYGIDISSGQISDMVRRFLDHLETLHIQRADALAREMMSNGGYVLHMDSTTEQGQGTMLVLYSSWDNWVLGAWKIKSESTAEVKPRIKEIVSRFGEPQAMMSDLGSAMRNATADAAAEMCSLPHIFLCQFHFLRDIGKDLLSDSYGLLRDMVSKSGITEKLRQFCKYQGQKIGAWPQEQAVAAFSEQLLSGTGFSSITNSSQAILFLIILSQWILDFKHTGGNQGFPFDRPYHDLYLNCCNAYATLERATEIMQAIRSTEVSHALQRLKDLLMCLLDDPGLAPTIRAFESRSAMFDELRSLFRLETDIPEKFRLLTQASSGMVCSASAERLAVEFRRYEEAMNKKTDRFYAKMDKLLNAKMAVADDKECIRIILAHLDRYGSHLWGHLIPIKDANGESYRIVHRTNNSLENFFHVLKHHERRRCGRTKMAWDLECLNPASALVSNLNDPEYLRIVCDGSIDNLQHLFSEIDQRQREQRKQTERRDIETVAPMRPININAACKALARSENFDKLVGSMLSHDTGEAYPIVS